MNSEYGLAEQAWLTIRAEAFGVAQRRFQTMASHFFSAVMALLLAGTGSDAAAAQAPSVAPSELERLLPYLDDDTLALPEEAWEFESCGARVLAAALGYRRDPHRFRNDFFRLLAVDDYAERAAGKYDFVQPDDVAATMQSAMAVPAGIADRRIEAVAGFCALRDRNLWVETKASGRVSLSRMIRGVALSLLLKGTDEDPLAIANAIDADASAAHRSPEQESNR